MLERMWWVESLMVRGGSGGRDRTCRTVWPHGLSARAVSGNPPPLRRAEAGGGL
ncbi:hypothetical protein GCM10008937_14160 [Deinococcus depolymerans]|uniref:Uncharacterized protein n=1 Tax=Deinococcus depolymerans TaxID=392408 RepID=A0ABN1BXQ3_9DEIO